VQSCTTPGHCTNHCTESCTDHCAGSRITVFGARGGSGTSTIAAALALCGRSMVATELATSEPAMMSALLGIAPPVEYPAKIMAKLTLATEPSGSAELTVIDGGTLTNPASAPRAAHELRIGVPEGTRAISGYADCSQPTSASMGSFSSPRQGVP